MLWTTYGVRWNGWVWSTILVRLCGLKFSQLGMVMGIIGPGKHGHHGPYFQVRTFSMLVHATEADIIQVRKVGTVPYICEQTTRRLSSFFWPLHNTLSDHQSGRAYRCFCSSDKLASTRERLARAGSNATYDKSCLNLTEEEVARRLRAGEKSVVRLNVST